MSFNCDVALKCATEGYPLAIVTEKGEMYKIVGTLSDDNNLALRDLLAKEVVAEGEIGDDDSGKTLNAQSVVIARHRSKATCCRVNERAYHAPLQTACPEALSAACGRSGRYHARQSLLTRGGSNWAPRGDLT